MTTVYFVRHAEPNYNNHNDMSRELSAKGMKDREHVTKFMADKGVDVVLSSPYKRAVDTIKEFADSKNLDIILENDFRERKVDSGWIEDFTAFSKAQWADFTYKLSDGECLNEVQKRNVEALKKVLDEYEGKTIVIGSHGTALSTIINFYDSSFGYAHFENIKSLMPWIVRFDFRDKECVSIQSYDIFEGKSFVLK